MEQQPPVSSQQEPQRPRRKNVEAARTARDVANEKRTLDAVAEGWRLKSRQKALSPQEHEHVKKGGRIPYKREPVSEEEQHQLVKKYLTGLNQRPPTAADYAAGASYYRLSEADQREYDRAITDAIEGLENEEPDPFFDALGWFGPRILLNPALNAFVEGWWVGQTNSNASVAEQKKAKQYLEKIGAVLSTTVSGRRKIAKAEREALAASCKKWYPICDGLNKEFKKRWENPKYANSEFNRKESRGDLAEKFSISVADVEAIEWSLKKPSRTAKKSTPTQAMCHIVARKHPGIGEKTVETIWLEYRKTHPEEGRRRQKTPTTSSAAERTA